MNRGTIITILLYLSANVGINADWRSNAVVYQVYPRSFMDSNRDGIGDLNGIITKLEHVAELGATAVWLSPIYQSPQVDFGYDISNFTDVDSDYGTLADFDRLVGRAKFLGLKVIMDFVPNHSSHLHPWFLKSVRRIKPYDEYYVWRNARYVNGVRRPPNNWLSNFQGSAWEWNNIRQQYYLHQFAPGQPDLNYRSAALNQEMKNVLTFWMNRGVDGFRIGAINHMFEDARFLDEPSANRKDIPKDDYESLNHIYTKNQGETYEVLRSWRKHLDDHSIRTRSGRKMILTEAYAPHNLTTKYYNAGSNVPFNFMFITDLNNQSSAADFKRLIDRWLSSVPKESVANWVVGNHDNHRVATRFGSTRADQISMLAMVLPGVAVVYNGDEIGMEDRMFAYYETRDPAGWNAGPNRFYLKSRDPARTPYQWDNTTNAGFTSSRYTWLPVHSNYRTRNLAAQKWIHISHYKVFLALSRLRQKSVIASGDLKVTVVSPSVLGVTRTLSSNVVALLINLSNRPVTVNARISMGLPYAMTVYIASVSSNILRGSQFYTTRLTIPASASVVYTTHNLYLERM